LTDTIVHIGPIISLRCASTLEKNNTVTVIDVVTKRRFGDVIGIDLTAIHSNVLWTTAKL